MTADARTFLEMNTERLIIRKFKAEDAAAFHRYRTDPRVARYQGERISNFTLEQAAEFVSKQQYGEAGKPETWLQLAIEHQSSKRLIGDMMLHVLEDPLQAEIGYTVEPESQGSGYATEAVGALVNQLFKRYEMHRIIAAVDPRNQSSYKLLEGLGFRREAHFIKNSWHRGEYADEYVYAILHEEWANL